MAVTIEMIQEKEFRRQANGYDTNEVDDLLDDIMDEMEAREHEMKDLRARLIQEKTAYRALGIRISAKGLCAHARAPRRPDGLFDLRWIQKARIRLPA